MNSKTFIWIGMVLGSTIGGFIPTLWGAGFLSFSSVIFSAAGALIGVYLGFKVSKY